MPTTPYNNIDTHTPFALTTKHGKLLARTTDDGADFSFHNKHNSITANNIQFTHKKN
jgi:hypothetical protein